MRSCPCGSSLEGRTSRARFCSAVCRVRAHKEQHGKRQRAYTPRPKVERTCATCGATFLGRPNAKLCSQRCRNRRSKLTARATRSDAYVEGRRRQARRYFARNPEKATDIARRRRARKRGAELGPHFSAREVAERDGNRCHLCGRKVELRLKHPHPRSASLDHVVPLAEGGAHELANVRLAHLDCNIRKGTRALGEQMLLFG